MQLLDVHESTSETLVYIRGNILRKLLNHSSCHDCISNLIENVKEKNTSKFVMQMDFSGSSLIEPSETVMKFFHLLLSVYVHHKPLIKSLSVSHNILKLLCTSGLNFLNSNNFSLPLCHEHFDSYTKLMIQGTMKTFLKAYIHEVNENCQAKPSSASGQNRKLNILNTTGNWKFSHNLLSENAVTCSPFMNHMCHLFFIKLNIVSYND